MAKITTRDLQRSTRDILNRVFQGETVKVCPRGKKDCVFISKQDPEIIERLQASLQEIATSLNEVAEKVGAHGVHDDWGA